MAWGSVLGAIAGVAAPSIAGWFSKKGQEKANKTNIQEAQKNRDFQREMSNTAWQRGKRDMELAGLNPALAYSQGGASSPGGTLAAKAENEAAPAVNSAIAANAQRKNLQLLDAQIAATRASADKTKIEARGVSDHNNILYGARSSGGQWEKGIFERMELARLEAAMLQLPYLRTSARVEESRAGRAATTVRRLLAGGGGISPLAQSFIRRRK